MIEEMASVESSERRRRFGAAVRKRRLDLGLSQEELAERSGLHRTYISDVERGARNVSLDNIGRIACSLGVSISSLFIETESMHDH